MILEYCRALLGANLSRTVTEEVWRDGFVGRVVSGGVAVKLWLALSRSVPSLGEEQVVDHEVRDREVVVDLSLVFTGWGPLPAITHVEEQSGPWGHVGVHRRPQFADGGSAMERMTQLPAARLLRLRGHRLHQRPAVGRGARPGRMDLHPRPGRRRGRALVLPLHGEAGPGTVGTPAHRSNVEAAHAQRAGGVDPRGRAGGGPRHVLSGLNWDDRRPPSASRLTGCGGQRRGGADRRRDAAGTIWRPWPPR